MCQFLYFYYMTGTQKFLYTFELSNILKEFIFSFTITYLISNLTFILFEMPITNLLLKLFNLNRRRDIKLENKLEDNHNLNSYNKLIKYDYIEINNNNPDFKPPVNKKLD